MRILFYLVFILCFQVKAEPPLNPCQAAVQEGPVHQKSYNGSHIYVLANQRVKPSIIQSLIDSIHITETSGARRLSEEWKRQVLKNLPQFKVFELLSLFNKLVDLERRLDLSHETEFFKSLEKATLKFLADFSKKELIEILWVFSDLDIKPGEDFVHLWRRTTDGRRSEFSPLDVWGLYTVFRQLEIPPRTFNESLHVFP